ncbi:MAG TPA: hypothetical protein VHQ03_03280, partial [Candidatus Dormibacteraeota bacterium]|nr:hypothetical protein [Candidatus Dormibacteraeota bacterium]
MSQGRRVFAAFTALAIGAGLAVAGGSSHAVRAANPTPGIVTTVAGGSTTGYATSIQQAPWGAAW